MSDEGDELPSFILSWFEADPKLFPEYAFLKGNGEVSTLARVLIEIAYRQGLREGKDKS